MSRNQHGRVHNELSTTLGDARRSLEQAKQTMASAASPDPATLCTAVEGVHQVATALTQLVATLMHHAPAAVEADTAREVVADLRAMHGCLTTGTKLMAPALDDLRAPNGAGPASRRHPPSSADPRATR